MVANGTGEDPRTAKDARLESLDQRLDRIKAEEERHTEGRMSAESQRVIKSAGMRILSDLIGLPFGAGLIGWLIDRWAGTTPWVMLAMLFLGFGLAVRSVLRVASNRTGTGTGTGNKTGTGK
jgi:ATP synthase protein I